MKRKLAASLAMILLIASVLVACSSKDAGSNGSPPTSNGGASSPEANGADKDKKLDKVYVYANFGNLDNKTETSKPEAVEEVRQYIKDQIGIEVHAIIPPKGSEKDKLNILLASNEPLDLFKGNMAEHQAKGAALDISQLLDQYGDGIKKLWPEEWAASQEAFVTSDGKRWGLPELPPLGGDTVLIRRDWLEQLNLELPKTMDEFENVLKEFKEKDPAGNGQTIPLLTDFNSQHSIFGLTRALAAGFMDVGYGNWIDDDGKVKPIVLNPGYRDFVEKMADWYKKGYIYKESFSLDKSREIELIKQNRVASSAVWYTTVTNNMHFLWDNNPDAMYVVPDELKGPKGDVTSSSHVRTTGIMFNKNAQNPEAAMKYINWVHSDIENYFTVFFGIKDKHWRYVDEQNKQIEMINSTDYLGDLLPGLSFAYSVQYQNYDPKTFPSAEFVKNYQADMGRMKKPGTFDVEYKFDQKEIASKLPNLSDLDRMMEQEIVKFIMGARPIEEYDKFLQELNKAGLQEWIEVYTEQYKKTSIEVSQ